MLREAQHCTNTAACIQFLIWIIHGNGHEAVIKDSETSNAYTSRDTRVEEAGQGKHSTAPTSLPSQLSKMARLCPKFKLCLESRSGLAFG